MKHLHATRWAYVLSPLGWDPTLFPRLLAGPLYAFICSYTIPIPSNLGSCVDFKRVLSNCIVDFASSGSRHALQRKSKINKVVTLNGNSCLYLCK